MRIGIDLDGVVYNFAAAFRRYLVAEHDFDVEKLDSPDQWEFWVPWGMTEQEFWSYLHQGVEAGVVFRHGAPYPNAVDVLAQLRAAGHTLHIVTNRTGIGIAHTVAWLADRNVPYDTLTFSADKTVVPVDVFVEDNVDNARAVAAKGVRSVLMDRTWNTGPTDIERVTSWQHFAEFVAALEQSPDDDGMDHTHDRTSKSGGMKGVKPERMSLIPEEALRAIARVYGHGERKYAAHNWRKGYPWSWSLDALYRHVGAFKDGETIDPESGECHLAHAGFHIFALLTWLADPERYGDFDDRWKPER